MRSLRWFAQTLRVLSRLITRRIFLVSLCCSRRTSPVPRSFHSEDSVANRKSFARLPHKPQALARETEVIENPDAHLEEDLLILFMSLGLDLLGELDHGLKLRVVLLFLCTRKNISMNFLTSSSGAIALVHRLHESAG